MKNNPTVFDTWRTTPRITSSIDSTRLPSNARLFPSGRTAIVAAMQYFTLSRADRIVIPEFSSHCLISSVGTFATPLPMRECVRLGEQTKAVLVYEQWGWPNEKDALAEAMSFADICILDCVDSADALQRHTPMLENPKCSVVVSLSKCLGLPAGGVLMVPETKNLPAASDETEIHKSDHCLFKLDINLYKTHARSIQELKPLLARTDLATALSEESTDRNSNLKTLLDSPLTRDWSETMRTLVETGCSAGIAPVLKGEHPEKLLRVSQQVRKALNVVAPVYNFNWSLNPVTTDYQPCLALPCHGELNVPELLPELEAIVQNAD